MPLRKNMTKSNKGTTIKANTTDTRMPAAREEMATKMKVVGLYIKKCYKTLQQYWESKSDKDMKQLDWTYMKIKEQ